jgi:hypothetical protein
LKCFLYKDISSISGSDDDDDDDQNKDYFRQRDLMSSSTSSTTPSSDDEAAANNVATKKQQKNKKQNPLIYRNKPKILFKLEDNNILCMFRCILHGKKVRANIQNIINIDYKNKINTI